MSDKISPIDQTKKWLSTIIIGHGLCPFAKKEYDNDRIHYAIVEATDLQSQLEYIMTQCAALDRDADTETSLLIFPVALSNFGDYLDVLEMATVLLEQQGYEGVYQLASFHPKYRFDDANLGDPSDYTNRSPYPMIHILREASVEAALENFPRPEDIPERNIQLTRKLGLSAMKASLSDCYK